ncbi:hypothetical protein [Brevibacterium gallinarum]|uniref:Secreted protein n=1 Tax=Brevibacterium gallinarum TaxID=2762220 RepID=A0ABR8WXX8_9MICO|nr:hypothetical protein [Brevibacterium gallinarum]MBD8021934.1 hypothetical protein [Brevibacterium gallinarum]
MQPRNIIAPVLATIAITSLGATALHSAEHDPNDTVSHNDLKTDPEVETVELDYPVETNDLFSRAETLGVKIVSVEYLISDGLGVYIYDTEKTAEENAADLEVTLHSQAPGGNPAVFSVTALAATQQPSHSDGSPQNAGSFAAPSSLLDEARHLPHAEPGDSELPRPDGLGDELNDSGLREDGFNTSSDEPPTRAHPNSIWFQTKDNVDGKRQVSIFSQWAGQSNTHKAPKYWWGAEIQLYQHNYNLPEKISRPLCAPGTDKRYWANASLAGATMTVSINDGTADGVLKSLEAYIDSNHLSDPCSTGAIGVGFGKPTVIPDMDINWGGGNEKLHQMLYVDLRLPKGSNSWSHISAATKYVQNNCQGHRSHTDCMGLSIDPGHPWPKDKLKGGTDFLLLNKQRKWRTPTHFSWDEYADRRPKALQ